MQPWSHPILFGLTLVVACDWVQHDRGSLRSTAALEDYRALVYTEGFAKRFQLPPEDSVSLDPGVLALAVHVYQDPDLNQTCSLSLYLDDSVPFAYPPGNEGRAAALRPETGPLFFATKLNDADTEAKLGWVRGTRVLIRSREYSEERKRGVEDSGPVDAFYRDLLPGLNVIEFTPICATLNPMHGAADVWLLREGHDTGELTSVVTSDAGGIAIRIAIPTPLLQAASDSTGKAARHPITFKHPPPLPYVVPRDVDKQVPRDGVR